MSLKPLIIDCDRMEVDIDPITGAASVTGCGANWHGGVRSCPLADISPNCYVRREALQKLADALRAKADEPVVPPRGKGWTPTVGEWTYYCTGDQVIYVGLLGS